MTSEDPNASQLRFDFLREEEPQRDVSKENIQADASDLAAIEKSALGEDANNLMEEIVDEVNMEMAWARVKANRGAPGPDGITVEDFPEWIVSRWQDVRRQLLDGTYRPDPVRRKTIAKPDGGTRELGIPNLLDRAIQTAIVLVLTPIFDPEFSESSFGYRPYRSAQDAARQVQKIIRSGRRRCVDMDLSKFFDRVQHDVLMARVSRKVHDKRLLKLIVNTDKSSIRKTEGLQYVGYEFRGFGGQFRVSRKKLDAFKERVSEIFRRKRGVSMKKRFAEFRSYAVGWLGYFQLDQVKTTFSRLDKWLRRRVRACYWKQWRKSKTRLRKLMSLGLSYRDARPFALSGKGPWRLAKTSGVQRALSNAYLPQ
jgi:retron-type reverse transcriptase